MFVVKALTRMIGCSLTYKVAKGFFGDKDVEGAWEEN
jgi:hypothetical protein